MIRSKESIEIIKEDLAKWDQYRIEMEDLNPEIKRKTFKEMFGYEIILHGNGGISIRGKRLASDENSDFFELLE